MYLTATHTTFYCRRGWPSPQRTPKWRSLKQKKLSLRGKSVVITARSTEKGGLFKALSAADILRAIKDEHDLIIPQGSVHVPEHIKTTGEHTVILASKTQKAELKVSVIPAV